MEDRGWGDGALPREQEVAGAYRSHTGTGGFRDILEPHRNRRVPGHTGAYREQKVARAFRSLPG
ncbi:MAG TPA: hypothetical protein PLX49_03830, partial [Prolixibacteraceae bacterium]|nr:hypothetical protein [Prolixibacteraceae bacterium]